MFSSSTNVLKSPLPSPLSGFCDYKGYITEQKRYQIQMQQKVCMQNNVIKYICLISVIIKTMKNNIDNITFVFDLPFDVLCFFLEGTMFMKELVQTLISEQALQKSQQMPSRCLLLRIKRLNHYNNIDHAGFPFARRTDYRML